MNTVSMTTCSDKYSLVTPLRPRDSLLTMKVFAIALIVGSRAAAFVPDTTTATTTQLKSLEARSDGHFSWFAGHYVGLHGIPGNRCSAPGFVLRSADSESNFETNDDEGEIQWDLFKKHHAKGSWKGVWTTYDYIGDVLDETVASVDLNLKDDKLIEHTHTIVVGAKRSDCATCFDSMEQTTLPIATYTPEDLRKSRFAAVSMVNGPSIIRSGAMATELVLAHGDGRFRALFQHAPVWEKGVEPGSCPPQGLKVFRVLVSREAIRPTPPTKESEANDPPTKGNPTFFRPVPPFNWHKKWAGTSWTWGPTTGNRGWMIDDMEETDAWHGINPPNESWNLRLPGGLFVQCPRVVTDATAGLFRLAWLPDDDNLLRVEAGVAALQPMIVDDDTMVGFEPPSLVSLRCDMMKNMGELENVSRPSRDWNTDDTDVTAGKIGDDKVTGGEDQPKPDKGTGRDVQPKSDNSGLDEIRDALSL